MPSRHTEPTTAVGLDFGTSTSLVARRRSGAAAEVLPIGTSARWLPSLVGFTGTGIAVGEQAERLPSAQVIRSVKQAITRNESVVPLGENGDSYSRDGAIIAILREITIRAARVGQPIDDLHPLRLGCPAMWHRDQRRLLAQLAGAAGLATDSIAMIEEPIAAGLSWLSHAREPIDGRLLVFDMGGGTLDIAVLDVEAGDPPRVSVLTSIGAPVAGDHLDRAIYNDLKAELLAAGLDVDSLERPALANDEVLTRARETKIALSNTVEQPVVLARPALGGERAPAIRYSRSRLEAAFRPQLHEAEDRVWSALRLARLTHHRGAPVGDVLRAPNGALANDVRYILLAGGMARIPLVRQWISTLLPAATIVRDTVEPDEAIVCGLTDFSGADLINMYRPGFDFALTWNDQTVPVYLAHTPLFEMNQLYVGQQPGFNKRLTYRDGIPRQRQGELRVTTPAGRPVRLIETDKFGVQIIHDRLPVRFGHYDVEFRFTADGRVLLSDGAGHSHELRLEPWPILRGADTRQDPVPQADPKVYYPFDRDRG